MINKFGIKIYIELFQNDFVTENVHTDIDKRLFYRMTRQLSEFWCVGSSKLI